MTAPTLSPEQNAGLQEITKWYGEALDGLRGPFRLFGPAGTGKTTMAKAIPLALGTEAAFMAYTGKACSVLRRKGVDARTIHSSIYYPTSDEEARERLREAETALFILRSDLEQVENAEAQISILEAEIAQLTAQSKRVRWEWNPEAFFETDPGILILDEVSMVNAKIAEEIERYGIPVLVLGDPAQLPPVEGGGHYINGQPDYMLEEIHRQALESPVLKLATDIRLSRGARLGITPADMEPASLAAAMEADQVICWSNKRRWALITAIRRNLGYPSGRPVEGDRIMCLTNNRDLSVFNGQQFTVARVVRKDGEEESPLGPTLRLVDDDGHTREIPVFADGFAGLELERQAKGSGTGIKGARMLATFAQVITCHKAQGSEWSHVYVVNELPSLMGLTARKEGSAAAEAIGRQWLYTAVTRAADRVTITRPATGR